MKILKRLLVAFALLVVAFVGAVVVSDVYRRVNYPSVPRHEADVFFDIGFVFVVSFAAFAVTSWVGLVLFRKRRPGHEGVPTDAK